MAGLTLAQFVEQLRASCDQSNVVTGYDIRVLDNVVLKARIYLVGKILRNTFIDVYFNPTNGTCSYTLVQNNRRIYGADNAFVGWHIHPFDNPDEHHPCGEVKFHEFLQAVEQWMI